MNKNDVEREVFFDILIWGNIRNISNCVREGRERVLLVISPATGSRTLNQTLRVILRFSLELEASMHLFG